MSLSGELLSNTKGDDGLADCGSRLAPRGSILEVITLFAHTEEYLQDYPYCALARRPRRPVQNLVLTPLLGELVIIDSPFPRRKDKVVI